MRSTGHQDLDLSQDEVPLHAIQAAIATGDLPRLNRLVSTSPPPSDTIRCLAKRCSEYSDADVDSNADEAFPTFTLSDPRICAARYGQVDIIKFLVESGLDMGHERNYKGGLTPLHCAAHYGHNPTIKFLLKLGMDIDAPTDYQECTALDLAIGADRKSTVKLLVRSHSHAFPEDGLHPIFRAIDTGDLHMVRLLFELDAGILQGSAFVYTPLDAAAMQGQPEIIEFLLDVGADIDKGAGERLASPLCFAAERGHLRAARTLIERGASVNGIGGNFGTTPLMSACSSICKSVQSMIDLLISNGADVNICRSQHPTSNIRRTALTEACSEAIGVETIERLLHHGAHVNLGSPPPLEILLRRREQNISAMRLLLKAGANACMVSETLRGIFDRALGKSLLEWRWQDPEEELQVLEQQLEDGWSVWRGTVLEMTDIDGMSTDNES